MSFRECVLPTDFKIDLKAFHASPTYTVDREKEERMSCSPDTAGSEMTPIINKVLKAYPEAKFLMSDDKIADYEIRGVEVGFSQWQGKIYVSVDRHLRGEPGCDIFSPSAFEQVLSVLLKRLPRKGN